MEERESRPGWWFLVAALLIGCARPAPAGAPVPATSPAAPLRLVLTLVLADGVAPGRERINVAVPMPPGLVTDATQVALLIDDRELPAARRGLARHPDGSLRSVQLQADIDTASTAALAVAIHADARRGLTALPLVAVADTLVAGSETPRVWVLLPASWLAASGVAGPLVSAERVRGTALAVWLQRCDPLRWDTAAFEAGMAERQGWLYDRVTAMLRIHASSGEPSALRSAYREAAIYRAGIPIVAGVATAIPVPGASDDVKYHYSQGLALHYLLTGDDRHREAAEAVAARVAQLWPDPRHDGGDGFWTERQAGFALLAYEWAAQVSDDRGAEMTARADAVVAATLAIQARAPGDADGGQCFAHSATAHGESFGYLGCSPWMSAILADGLDSHARRVGGATAVRIDAALLGLGRSIAHHGLDRDGKPYYWMGAGNRRGEIDEYDEHWGEAAYLVALAWARSGPRWRAAADRRSTDRRLRRPRRVGHLRSFNWQCRSAIMTPALLLTTDQPGR